jgi:hypothetical protein
LDHVFHNESQAWIPIQDDPDYQRVQVQLSQQPAKVARASGASSPAGAAAGSGAGAGDRTGPVPPASNASQAGSGSASILPADQVTSSLAQGLKPLPLPRPALLKPPASGPLSLTIRVLGIATPVVAAALLAWSPTEGGEDQRNSPAPAARRVQRAERARAAELTQALSEAIAPSRPLPFDSQEGPDSLLPVAEGLRASQGAGRARKQTYAEAYADAQVMLEEALDLAGVRDLFAAGRFTAPDSMRVARRTIAAALNILRTYHGQEVMLEQSFHPGGGGSPSLRESFETAEAGRNLLQAGDTLFGLLLAGEGRYAAGPGGIRFTDPALARRYGLLWQEVVALAGSMPAIPRESSAAGATGRLRRAIGDDLPPLPVN